MHNYYTTTKKKKKEIMKTTLRVNQEPKNKKEKMSKILKMKV